MTIQTDATTKGWGTHCNGISSGRRVGIVVLELMAVKIAILTFTKNLSNLTIHIQMDNEFALLYLLEMGEGRTHSAEVLKTKKLIWHYLLSHGIIIIAEYLPSKLSSISN